MQKQQAEKAKAPVIGPTEAFKVNTERTKNGLQNED